MKLFSKIKNSVKYIFIVSRTIDDWFNFLIDHAHLKKYSIYNFRNGMKISLIRNEITDWSTDMIMDIFVRKDYGDIGNKITVVDIGANIGAFTLYCAYNHNNIVYAYEPELTNFNKLKENVHQNSLGNKVKIFNMAVAGECKDVKLFKHISIAHSLNQESKSFDLVKCIDLNTLIYENKIDKIDLLKIDCEGSEFDIIYNTTDDSFSKIRNCIIEYHNYSQKTGYDGDSLITYLEQKGFKLTDRKSVQEGMLGIIKLSNTNIAVS